MFYIILIIIRNMPFANKRSIFIVIFLNATMICFAIEFSNK